MESTGSPGIFPQILMSVAVVVAVYIIFTVGEILYRAYLGYGNVRIPVYPYTGNRSIKIEQNPANPSSKTLPLSENQLTGIEFSYSTFVYISDDTFGGDASAAGWKTLFYKGYESSPFPLLGPGVFVSNVINQTGSPTLRVVMNTYDSWFTPIDVTQIPINKWFHLALVLRSNRMEIYINGNLANKKTFHGTLPYQNYQPLNLFPNVQTIQNDFTASTTESKRGIPAGENFYVMGKASGYLSNMIYFSYALSYSEIQGLLNMGPSKEFDQSNMDMPPYLIDSWWTSRKQ
jgi:hypothetical protein